MSPLVVLRHFVMIIHSVAGNNPVNTSLMRVFVRYVKLAFFGVYIGEAISLILK